MCRSILEGLTEDGRIHRCTGQLRRKDSRIFHAETNAKKLTDRNGVITGLEGYVRDVSKEEEANRSLQVREERFSHILNSVQRGIGHIDMDGRITYANRYMIDMLGYPSEEDIIGNRVIDHVTPALRDSFSQQMKRTMDSLKSSFEMEFQRCDGSLFQVIAAVAPEMDEDGNVCGVFGSFADNSEQVAKRLEMEHLTRTLKAIRQVNHIITKERSLDVMIKHICDALIATGGYSSAWIGIYRQGTSIYEKYASAGIPEKNTNELATLLMSGKS